MAPPDGLRGSGAHPSEEIALYTYWPNLARIVRFTLTRRYFRPRHLAFISVFLTLQLGFRVVSYLFQALDYVLFPGFRRQVIERPVFIIANPRSGTTFMHRLLEQDEQFTTLKLWQTVLPSVTLYKIVFWLGRVDRVIGRPLGAFMGWVNRVFFDTWDGIHASGFERSEEDEQLFVYYWLTPGIMIFFPYFRRLPYVARLDDAPPRVRAAMARHFRLCMQRHVYAMGGDKTLLLKNALAAGRLGIYREAFPDLRVVHLVRDPVTSVSSALSLFTKWWQVHAPNCYGPSQESRDVAEVITSYYATMIEAKKGFGEGSFAERTYDALVDDPEATVREVYHTLELPISDSFERILVERSKLARDYESVHAYDLQTFGIDEAAMREGLAPIYAHYGLPQPLTDVAPTVPSSSPQSSPETPTLI